MSSGLPESMAEKEATLTRYELALKYLVMKRPHAVPDARVGTNESSTTATKVFPDDRPGRPSHDLLRKALRNSALVLPGPAHRESPTVITNTLHWLERASHPRSDLGDAAVGPGPQTLRRGL